MGDDTNNTYIFDKGLESRIKNSNRSIWKRQHNRKRGKRLGHFTKVDTKMASNEKNA